MIFACLTDIVEILIFHPKSICFREYINETYAKLIVGKISSFWNVSRFRFDCKITFYSNTNFTKLH